VVAVVDALVAGAVAQHRERQTPTLGSLYIPDWVARVCVCGGGGYIYTIKNGNCKRIRVGAIARGP
jgi:hypothetical protein